MTLGRRLWFVLAGLFLVPVVVGALVVLLVVPDARAQRTTADVRATAASMRAQLADTCGTVRLAAVATLAASGSGPLSAAPGVAVETGSADYAAVVQGGRVTAEAGTPPPGPRRLPG